MSVTEIKTVISQLPPPELAELSEWIEELKADAWDRGGLTQSFKR